MDQTAHVWIVILIRIQPYYVKHVIILVLIAQDWIKINVQSVNQMEIVEYFIRGGAIVQINFMKINKKLVKNVIILVLVVWEIQIPNV